MQRRAWRASYEVALLIVLAVCATAPESLAQNAGVNRSPDKMAPIQIQEIARFDARFERSSYPYTRLAFSPDGRVLVLLTDAGDGLLIETATGRELARPRQVVAISPDNRCLVTRSEDKTGRLIDTARGTEATLSGRMGAVAFSWDGRVLAVTDEGGNITRLIDTATGQVVGSAVHDYETPVDVVEVSSYGSWTTDSSDELSLGVETPNGEVRVHLTAPGGSGGSSSDRGLSPNGRWRGGVGANTAVGSMYYVRLYEAASDRQIASDRRIAETVCWGDRPEILFSPDSSLLAATAGLLIDTATGVERARFEYAQSIAFSPDSRWLATGADGELRLIDTTSGAVLTRVKHDGQVAVAFSPDGTLLATVSTAGTAPTLQSTVRLLRVNP